MRAADICLHCALISRSVVLQATVSPLAGEASPLPPRGSSSLKCLFLKRLPFFARLNTSMEGLKAHPFQWLARKRYNRAQTPENVQ